MARTQNKLITSRMPWHANMTELNHLGAAMIAKPEVFESKMTQIFTSKNYYSGNPMSAVLSQMGNEKTIDKSSWEWQLKGANTRPLISVENIEVGNSTPGKFKTDFKLKLDEDWYLPGDVISPGSTNKKLQCRIQEKVGKQGNGYVYIVRLMTDDPQISLPVTYLEQGQKWSKLFAQYEEAAEQSGSTQYSLPMTLQNRMSRFRKMYRVTGDAAQEVLAVKIPGPDGSLHDAWIKYAEVEYWQQWYKELERGYWYSRSTNTVIGANGRPILSGPGIQEQLEDGHNFHYSHLSAKLIEEYLMDIFYSRVKPGQGREIKAFTGEYGMLQFHRAIQDIMEKRGFIQVVDDMFIKKTKSDYNANALEYGYQFTKYRMANGSTLELIHNPLYDDREINFEIDPVSGYPMESQRITFLDFSNNEGGNNIQVVNKKNSTKLGYVGGMQTPYGPTTGNKAMAHAGDYYEMHIQKQCGIHIEDVTKCGELILTRN